MPDEEYRALLFGQTGKHSCKDMTVPERQRVREHLQQLARRAGLERAGAQPRRAKAARPLEGKVWALWHALGRAGKLDRSDAAALRAWVRRQVGVDDIGWCSNAQLHSLIESLKLWQGR
ncbi:MAG: regulatory protein GemA [Pseudomonadota bacterium]|nr:regulatory protein GemA [Pseudomonadota bacterium]